LFARADALTRLRAVRPLSCRRVQAYPSPKVGQPAKLAVIIIIRIKGEYLGSVEAPDREGAEAVAIKQFALDDDQRSLRAASQRVASVSLCIANALSATSNSP
jgi:hypothetical protein